MRCVTSPRKRRLASPALVVILLAGCAPSLDNRPRPREPTDGLGLDPGKLRFPSQDIAAKHTAATDAPQSFEAVVDYGRSVVLFCLASLLDTSCSSCEGALPSYRPRSELNTAYWPVIEDALLMLDPFTEGRKEDPGRMELLVEVKGRLLWLAGRSNEEQALIDSYAFAHPTALSVVKRRLEILRESGDVYLSESQCTRSRERMKSAPEASRLDLLTNCVVLHPNNGEATSDTTSYATFLPNLSGDEEALYRTHLVQRCTEKVGDEGERCAKACACETQNTGKPPAAKCRRACGGCRKETARELLTCKKLGEAAPEPAPSRPRRTRSARR